MSDSNFLPNENDEIRFALCETVESLLKSKKYKISVSSASQAGENNFISIVYRATFSKDSDDPSETNASNKLILKVAPQNVNRREQFLSRELFLREMYIYNVVNIKQRVFCKKNIYKNKK